MAALAALTNARASGRSPPGCSSATTSAASRSSTRSSTCRSRCRRSSPGSSLLALYGSDPLTRSVVHFNDRVHALGDLPRAAVRDAAVRRANGAAGAARARHGDGAGGALARRERVHRRSAGSCCRTSSRASSPGVDDGVRARGRRDRLGHPDHRQPARSRPRSRRCSSSSASSGDPHGAAAVSVVLLAISFVVLLLGRRAPPLRDEARACVSIALRFVALGYLLIVLLGAARDDVLAHVPGPVDGAWAAITTHNTVHAFKLTLIVTAIAVPVNTVFGVVCGLAIVRGSVPRPGAPQRVRRPAARALARRRRALARPPLRPRTAGSASCPTTASRSSSRCRRSCSRRSSSRSRSSHAR